MKPQAEMIDDIMREAEEIAAVLSSGLVLDVQGERAPPDPAKRSERYDDERL